MRDEVFSWDNMATLITENNIAIALSVLFWLAPVVLTIHLAIERTESRNYKQRLGYIYGGLWAIAVLGYGWLFIR